MKRATQAPIRTDTDSPVADWREVHPAYGAIGFSRISGHRTLFESKIDNHGYIELTISTAELSGDAYSRHLFPRGALIKVAMTDAQFVAMITRGNGNDVPCTITYVQGEVIPEIAAGPRGREQLSLRTDALAQKLKANVDSSIAKVKTLLEKVPPRLRAEIANELERVSDQLHGNTEYAAERLTNHTENMVVQAEMEIQSTITAAITRLGMADMKQLAAAMAADPATVQRLLGRDSNE